MIVTLTEGQIKTLNRIRLRGIIGNLIAEQKGEDIQVTYASDAGELIVATVEPDGTTKRFDLPL